MGAEQALRLLFGVFAGDGKTSISAGPPSLPMLLYPLFIASDSFALLYDGHLCLLFHALCCLPLCALLAGLAPAVSAVPHAWARLCRVILISPSQAIYSQMELPNGC